jgi:putative restriction endonuclease
MAKAIAFGEIPGYPEGSSFADRTELFNAGLHRRTQHGISGLAAGGADAIALNGGYRDDRDFGDVIVYTGEGGRDPSTGRQVADQTYDGGNRALVVSGENALPIRIIRGPRGEPAFSPKVGYRYDGLFRVVRWWQEPSTDGPIICRFRLEREKADATAIESIDAQAAAAPPAPGGPAPRVETAGQRLARRAEIARWVKRLYDYTCQICGLRLVFTAGPYAECAHIRPLGTPDDGADDPGNVLCLCPNDHVRLDRGAIVITDDLNALDRQTGATTPLTVDPSHAIDLDSVRYHRKKWR